MGKEAGGMAAMAGGQRMEEKMKKMWEATGKAGR